MTNTIPVDAEQLDRIEEKLDRVARHAASLRVALRCLIDQCSPDQLERAQTLALSLGAVGAVEALAANSSGTFEPPTERSGP